MRRIKKWSPVMVEWLDAHGGANESWGAADDIDMEPILMVSVGQVVHSGPSGICLALSRNSENDLLDAYIFCPDAYIVRVTRLAPA